MKRSIPVLLITIWMLSVVLAPGRVGAATVRLAAAASMTDAVRELIQAFTAAHPGVTIQPNFASSGSLAKQIIQGAPVDLYISANQRWMNWLVENRAIDPGTARILAHNALVFIGPSTTRARTMLDLTSLARIGIGSPKSVPAGQYAAQAMENAGIYRQLLEDRCLVMAKDVRQALLYADRGEVDGAFVYRTDARLARKSTVLFTVPPELHDPVSYPIGLTPEGRQNPEARAFYSFATGPLAAGILKSYGFTPPEGEQR
ncbi:molybdate ABC transporter substrate-binding protein [Desulfolithobacter dissulfuricans]|uniref:Molybdate ABC transporter substrate-binding protein n=1 Tax=Desulfolithobacter dissulfuricans TaxID=2795293 RepID=A0A915XKV0_9BACT|nr:molybdate ABC transporter substrate-binding protein [Desulfolithobacter dissulfuricans]BCO10482.1 molybdate ABC transporter substrate-binding protein [Desulfolithobacter dissulfuricans]